MEISTESPLFSGDAQPLTESGLRAAANILGTDAATLLAVMQVETSGCGFLPDKRLVMAYERHIFHNETNGKFDDVASCVSNSKPGGYNVSAAEKYRLLEGAMTLDADAALRSASWGIGQIMGFNFKLVKYSSVREMIGDFADDEDAQVMAISTFCRSRGLDDELRRMDWAGFAYGYNGPKFRVNQYDVKLSHAYAWHSTHNIDLELRATQMQLMFSGLYRARIDGVDGVLTQRAKANAQRRGIEL